MKINKEEWREMMGLADADERQQRGLDIGKPMINNNKNQSLKENIQEAINNLQKCLETLDDNP